jgi:hypothetical protein
MNFYSVAALKKGNAAISEHFNIWFEVFISVLVKVRLFPN